MRAIVSLTVVALACLFAGNIHAEGQTGQQKDSPAFQKVKALEGIWVGTEKKGDKEEEIQVLYEVTSGGTAVEEKLFAGTPKEMVTVYTQDGDDVIMTHYCSLGNQPRMKNTALEGNKMTFSFVDATGMKSKNEPHMGGLTLTFKDKNELIQEWILIKDGKATETIAFQLKRQD